MDYNELLGWLETCPTHKFELLTLEDDFAVVMFSLSSYNTEENIEILDDDDYSLLSFDDL